MKNLTKREKNILWITISCALLYLSVHFIYEPMKVSLGNKIEMTNTLKRDLRRKIKMLKESQDNLSDMKGILKKYQQSEPNEQIMSNMLTSIQKTAKDLEMQISDLKPSPVKNEKDYKRFSVSMTINAPFVEAVNFIHVLQTGSQRYFLDDIQFDKGARRDVDRIKTRLSVSQIRVM